MTKKNLENIAQEEMLYIANQKEGPFDEVQRFLMAYEQRKPILMGGDPGSGKTHLTKFIGTVLGKKTHRINCEPEQEIPDLLGHEVLVAEGEGQNKTTATGFKKGEMVAGMENGDIVYLDEFNKLKHGVQKGLNSILEDISTYRLNGVNMTAHKDTCYVMAYNPGTGTDYEDIEAAVFDRCEYIRFEEQPNDFQVRVAMVKAGLLKTNEIIDEDIEERAVEIIDDKDGKQSYRFLTKGDDNNWYEFGTSHKIEPHGELKKYFFYKGAGDQKLTTENKRANKYYDVISELSEYIHLIKEVLKNGSNELPDDFMDKFDIGRFNKLEGHIPSFRMVLNNVKKYVGYTEKHNMSPEMAKEQIAYDIINTVCAKIPSNQKIGENITPKQLFKFMAMAKDLLPKGEYADIPDLPSHY